MYSKWIWRRYHSANTEIHNWERVGETPHPNVTLIADLRGLVNHRLKPWETQVRGKALKFLTSTRMASFQEHTNPKCFNPV